MESHQATDVSGCYQKSTEYFYTIPEDLLNYTTHLNPQTYHCIAALSKGG